MASSKPPLALQASLSLASGDGLLAGEKRMALLEAIAGTGSITQAAKAIGLSYKAAWDAVEAMNNLADEPLVARMAGGSGGGGTALTARGAALVASYRVAAEQHARFVDALNQSLGQARSDLSLLQRLTMKTSARNQLWGRVVAITRGAVNDEITLQLRGGDRIVAIITQASTEAMGLAVGTEAAALIKASWVMLAVIDESQPRLRISARNQLRGRVVALQAGAVNTDVTVELAGGNTLSAVITQSSAEALALTPGDDVVALIKASSVILSVAS